MNISGTTNQTTETTKRPFKDQLPDVSVKQRRDWVMGMVLEGDITHKEIRLAFADKFPNLSHHTLLNDLKVIYEIIRETLPTSEQIIIDHLNKYHNIYKNCIENRDNKTAMQALKEIERLYQIADNKKQKITIKQTVNLKDQDLSFDQLKQLLGRNDDTDNALLINSAHNFKGINIQPDTIEIPIQEDLSNQEPSSNTTQEP